MATLALAAAGAAVGGALLPGGLTLFGTTLAGATIGGQLGALSGSVIDQALFGASGQSRELSAPRLSELRVTSSTEGAPIPRIYGRVRVGGQLIWATDHQEEATTTEIGGSGKGGGLGGSAQTTTEYRYYANFAVALAEGEISGLGRIWADGTELDLSTISYRLYLGSETQQPDSLIEAHEGPGATPAYRGIAYIVFEHLPIAPYGNRIPQLSFEVHRTTDTLNNDIRSVVIIPGSGEFAYATEPVTRTATGNVQHAENVHTRQAPTDWSASIDQLEATLPNARCASLVVSWFGTDLRAGACEIRPGVESNSKSTAPVEWRVAGQTRQSAYVVSQKNERPVYGGTPTDLSVMQAIADLKSREIEVILTPFILMDIADGNTLADPYSSENEQPPYPWRGRITVTPAPGQPSTTDLTPAAAQQVANFVGTALPADFAIITNEVVYTGPEEWSYRRHILHYAWLAKAAGGVDGFVIGTELRGLTQIRDSASSYPFVAALVALAADVRAVLGPATKITYAADWSEYFGHQPADGSNDVYFHLDPLWASPDIDAIGIDLYWPLSDWRKGNDHLDASAGPRSIYDLDYLKSNLAGGEGYDWYYATDADRTEQLRTPITDGYGKPWVYRYKDLRAWWSNHHYERPNGVEAMAPTAWIPQSKPIWLMETGCPALDMGPNQPNVFYDPKSSESALPHFSDGQRDDLAQRQYIRALVEAFDPDHPGYVNGLNPSSAVYGAPMVDPRHLHVYAWDGRPFPAFPYDTVTWSDGDNWRFGHWINGRLASMSLAGTVAAILEDSGFQDFDAGALTGIIPGYIIDRVLSARETLQPLELAYFFDTLETGGRILFRHRGRDGVAARLLPDDLVEYNPATPPLTIVRQQETDLPQTAKVTYFAATGEYPQAVAEARRLAGASRRVSQATLPLVLESDQADALTETWLFETWASREQISLTLPPSRLALEPGDIIALDRDGHERLFRITEIGEHGARDISALSFDGAVYDSQQTSSRRPRLADPPLVSSPIVEFLDLPLLIGDEPDTAAWVAASLAPWPGQVAFFRSPEATGFTLAAMARISATFGTTEEILPPGPTSRLDKAATLSVRLDSGTLTSITHLKMLSGSNAAALRHEDGQWEVIQFQNASLIGAGNYRLSNLLRGQAGTEAAITGPLSAGARFVLLDAAMTRADLRANEIGLPLNWRFGPANRDIGHSSFGSGNHTFSGIARRPFSPVHARAHRVGQDLHISWTRRTRRDGDSWAVIEVPLGEDAERYEIDILDESNVVRTLISETTATVYSADQQVADFGSPRQIVNIAIHQTNQSFGRSSPLRANV